MSPTSELPRGTRLHNGDYALGEVLGRGGFGITYKGGDMARKRYVAIKEYFPSGALRQNNFVVMADAAKLRAGVADFLGEARVLGRFHHAGIVGVAGSFEENNTAYMVMEWIEGETLETRIKGKGRIDEWEALDIGARLAGALETIHGAGILHRDIKPENIILRKNAGATLIDFGTARAFDNGATKMTQVVTPGYAPLEQYAQNARRGPASDIYALAATLYHALSGCKPVAATDRAADIPLPSLQSLVPNLTPLFATAIMGALEMEWARRPQSAREFEAQLRGQTPAHRSPPLPIAPRPTAATARSVAPGARPPIPVQTAAPRAQNAHSSQNTDAELGAILRNATLEGHGAAVMALAFAPDSSRLISASEEGRIGAWNWMENQNESFWSAHRGGVLALSFSPDGALLASGGRDERIHIWDGADLTSSAPKPLATLEDCRGVVRALAFCPARRELVVADAGAVTLWDADSGSIKARRDGGAVAISWAPDGSALAVASALDGALQLWNAADLSERGRVAAHQGALTAIAWSPDGALIATAGSDGAVRAWGAAQGAPIWERQPGGVPGCANWSPDGRVLAVGRGTNALLWRANGDVFRHYSLPKTAKLPNRGRIEAIRFAPQTQAPFDYVIASATRDNTIDICRIRTDPML